MVWAPVGGPGGISTEGRPQEGTGGPICSWRVQWTHRSPHRQAGLCVHRASSHEDSLGPVHASSLRAA